MESHSTRQRRTETPVVPLHAHRLAAASRAGNLAVAPESAPVTLPASDLVPLQPPPPGSASAGARARRASRTREAHDGWTFVVIPPGAGARPRTLRVSVRRLRVATLALVSLAGTAIVSGSLLAIVVSMAPTIQPEAEGVRLGVLADDQATAAPDSAAALTALLETPMGIAAAASAAMDAAAGRGAAAPAATAPARTAVRPAAKPTAPRRAAIAPPSVSGRRAPSASAEESIAEARAHGLPVIGRITSRFSNARTHPMLGVVRPHNGVDIAAPSGTPITAAAAGRVTFAGRKFGFGNTVEIDHGNGVMTRYAHARSIKVRTGARVESGATIATVGRTGLASGPHLHFEVLVNGSSVDPLKRPVASLVSPAAAIPAAGNTPEVNAVAPPSMESDSAVARGAATPGDAGPDAATPGGTHDGGRVDARSGTLR